MQHMTNNAVAILSVAATAMVAVLGLKKLLTNFESKQFETLPKRTIRTGTTRKVESPAPGEVIRRVIKSGYALMLAVDRPGAHGVAIDPCAEARTETL